MAGFDITPSAVLVALVQAVLLTGVASLANYVRLPLALFWHLAMGCEAWGCDSIPLLIPTP